MKYPRKRCPFCGRVVTWGPKGDITLMHGCGHRRGDLNYKEPNPVLIHGRDCPKVEHSGAGYLHADDYDGGYDVDGVQYCGRCHGWIGT